MAQTITVTPGNVAFTPTVANSDSAYQSIVVRNVGATPVTFGAGDPVLASGAHPTEFRFELSNGGATQCFGKTLATNQECTIRVLFRPLVSGARSATWQILPSSGVIAMPMISLTGTGLSAAPPPPPPPPGSGPVDNSGGGVGATGLGAVFALLSALFAAAGIRRRAP